MSEQKAYDPAFRAGVPMVVGLLTVSLLFSGFIAWGIFTQISGAVIASGRIVVERNRQVIQHLDGGIIEQIMVREGDQVENGETLIQLDPTVLQSELALIEGQLYELMSRRGRLEAERDSTDTITFDPELVGLASENPQIARMLDGQQSLFEARNDTQKRQVEQFRNQRKQLSELVNGIDIQIEALKREQELIVEELENQTELLEKGLAPVTRVLALKREEARLAGRLGGLASERARALSQISELEIQEIQLVTQRREEAITNLRDFQYNENQLSEQSRTLRKQIGRLEIRAPISGVVYDLRVAGPQSVIRAADPLLYLVPQDQPLIIETRLDPIHVDQVYRGQKVVLRFAAFDMRKTPDLFGTVTQISPDAFVDEQTGASWYRVEIELPEDELTKLPEGQPLVPGMPVDAFIRTADRTPMAYLLEPLSSYIERAFRDG